MKAILTCVAIAATGAHAAAAEPVISCRAIGSVAEQGETACIQTNLGMRLARCGMVLNVSSWTFLEEPCPSGASEPLPPEPQDDGAEGENPS